VTFSRKVYKFADPQLDRQIDELVRSTNALAEANNNGGNYVLVDDETGKNYKIVSRLGVIGIEEVVNAESFMVIKDEFNGKEYRLIAENGVIGLQEGGSVDPVRTLKDGVTGTEYRIFSGSGVLGLEEV
jgi:hypothetical protein